MYEYAPELSTIEERYRKKIQSIIKYCMYCQPYDEGEPVWIYGDRTDMYELFYEYNVPEKYWQNILSHLGCPYCGSESFELGTGIGTETSYEKSINKHIASAQKLYGKEVKKLEQDLENYPLLVLNNKLAKKIHKELMQKTLPVCSVKGIFFRARKVDSSEVYSSDKMYNPPKGKSTEGRFNHAGQSHLYLASTEEVAIKEVINEEPSLLVWNQKFLLKKKVLNILDLTFDWINLSTSTSILLLALQIKNTIGRKDRNNELWRPDYYLTRFIMDCAKSLKYNGIKYNATKESTEFNIVLFYPDKLEIVPDGNPRIEIFMNKNEQLDFVDDLLDFKNSI